MIQVFAALYALAFNWLILPFGSGLTLRNGGSAGGTDIDVDGHFIKRL